LNSHATSVERVAVESTRRRVPVPEPASSEPGTQETVVSLVDAAFVRIATLVAALAITGVVLVWVLVAAFKPLPGRDVTMATGPPGSAYAHFAERYQQIMAREGVRLHLVPTNGAVADLERLRDPAAGVSAGFSEMGFNLRLHIRALRQRVESSAS
jgi:hypothetical protein